MLECMHGGQWQYCPSRCWMQAVKGAVKGCAERALTCGLELRRWTAAGQRGRQGRHCQGCLHPPCRRAELRCYLQLDEGQQNNEVGQCVQQRRQQEAVAAAAAGGSGGGRCDDYINRVHDTVNVSSQRAAPRLPVARARFWPGLVAPSLPLITLGASDRRAMELFVRNGELHRHHTGGATLRPRRRTAVAAGGRTSTADAS